MADVTVNTKELEEFGKELNELGQNLKDPTPALRAIGRDMVGVIRQRVKKSVTVYGTPMKGILVSSFAQRTSGIDDDIRGRAKRLVKGARGAKVNLPRVSLSLARPLLTDGQAAKSVAKIENMATTTAVVIAPTIGKRGTKADSMLAFHHAPQFSGHGKTKGNMPDRSFHAMNEADGKRFVKITSIWIDKEIREAGFR